MGGVISSFTSTHTYHDADQILGTHGYDPATFAANPIIGRSLENGLLSAHWGLFTSSACPAGDGQALGDPVRPH